jgi:hypothetical protein
MLTVMCTRHGQWNWFNMSYEVLSVRGYLDLRAKKLG